MTARTLHVICYGTLLVLLVALLLCLHDCSDKLGASQDLVAKLTEDKDDLHAALQHKASRYYECDKIFGSIENPLDLRLRAE